MLDLEDEDRGPVVVVTVAGEVDMSTCPQLEGRLQDALRRSSRVVVRLDGVRFLGSDALDVLVRAARAAVSAGGAFALAGGTRGTQRVLDITGLHATLNHRATVDAAVAAVAPPVERPQL